MGHDISELTIRLVLELAVILAAAKVATELSERWLRLPGVLGELTAGIIIGPYALGRFPLPGVGPLFPLPEIVGGEAEAILPVSIELYALAQIGAIILLFLAGLETHFQEFLRYSSRALIVAIGGVVVPFAAGVLGTVALGFAASPLSPAALFVGAILTATSIGITARVLSDIRRLNTPEGVTVLASAVIDDILGILLVSIVVGISISGRVSPAEIGVTAGKAVGFWLVLMAGGIALSGSICRLLGYLRGEGAAVAVALSIAFLCAALAEMFGLAMIIGAYSIGLALSRTDMAHDLQRSLAPVYHVLAPVFFVVMGMLVSYEAIAGAFGFGIIITLLAILSKLAGCGLPALALGFNRWGALRLGIGMLPRGEVALIVAGVGLAYGAIDQQVFGVSVMMTFVTTLLAPLLLIPAFQHGGPGLTRPIMAKETNPQDGGGGIPQ